MTASAPSTETSVDHTQFRQYTSQLARWLSPDPAGLLVADPSNPQSWNRYSYVLNNPLNFIDPFGLDGLKGDDCPWDASCEPGSGGGPCSFDPSCGGGIGIGIGLGGGGGGGRGGGGNSQNGSGAPKPPPFMPPPWVFCDPRLDWTCGPAGFCDPGIDLSCGINPNVFSIYLANIPWGRSNKGDSFHRKGKKGNNCQDSFDNSTLGKVVEFGSAINAVTSVKGLLEWTLFPAAKFATLEGIKQGATAVGNTEFLSLTDAGASVAIEAPTAAGIDFLESATPAGLILIPVATAFDAGMRNVCGSFPNATPHF